MGHSLESDIIGSLFTTCINVYRFFLFPSYVWVYLWLLSVEVVGEGGNIARLFYSSFHFNTAMSWQYLFYHFIFLFFFLVFQNQIRLYTIV